MSFDVSSLFGPLQSALSSNNLAGATAAVTALQAKLTANSQVTQTATAQLNALSMGLQTKNALAAGLALNSLEGMRAQLPASVGPQLDLLSNPAIQNDPVASATAIAAIATALVH